MTILGIAALFGVVQGLTEFLPVSSSGHLVLLHSIADFHTSDDLAFDVALHVGTLVALVAYFRRDIAVLWRGWIGSLAGHPTPESRLAWFLLVGSIPAALAGAFGEQAIEEVFRNPHLVVLTLTAGGLLLWLADRWGKMTVTIEQLRWSQVLGIGFGQALALIPGVSRSGATIIVGRLIGLGREAAARFSFLLAIPITAAAGAKQAVELDFTAMPASAGWEFLVGGATAAIAGYLAIGWLLKFISRRSYAVFAAYRFAAAAVALLLLRL